MYDGKAVLKDGRTVTAYGTLQEIIDWVENLIYLYEAPDITITAAKGR